MKDQATKSTTHTTGALDGPTPSPSQDLEVVAPMTAAAVLGKSATAVRRGVTVACVLLLFSSGMAAARMRRVAPVRVRLVTYVGEKLEGARPDFTWTVTYQGKRYQLYVLNLQVLGGGLTPLDINSAVSFYPVQFQLAGEKTALQRFTAAPPRQQVLMTGYMRLDPAGRYFMLDTVDAAYLSTPSPAK